jgi:hypothetical protein
MLYSILLLSNVYSLKIDADEMNDVIEVLSIIPHLYNVLIPMFTFLTFYEGDVQDASTVCVILIFLFVVLNFIYIFLTDFP